ncbi:MAG: TRAP transporter small permease [Deltaproteobacteria bacterium]|nr:TRAP transporter small permease [Deltaproteobacteria bacterium]
MTERLAERISRYLLYIGMGALLFMLLVNFVDVIGAKLFKRPLPGATEYTSLFQVAAISTAIAYTLIERRHIRIDFLVNKLRKRARKVVSVSVTVLEIILFVIIVWRGFLYGHSLMKAGEVGATSELPFYPFAFILAISGIPVILILTNRIFEELKK